MSNDANLRSESMGISFSSVIKWAGRGIYASSF
jgi:hypothetical protein